ncbi:OLC1v1039236C1 [Oldenlandia corymbosa var. corymbosa]|uniref:OLC1v1039236C1 n=1 Tax=Oldenlandia corymbosa var. corymbosa TaxID=529605 RepID=A0AAV1D1T2_OLDCO|nr:OLC1v1039236C1 [Oldenlandia corymbosa var. corymbosa]
METAQTTSVNQPPSFADPTLNNVSSSRKRPFDNNVQWEYSPYYKMRAIVRDLRPHFIEVLKTPDFRNCKAAEEIREKMRIVMDLYKVIGETSSVEMQDGQKNQSHTKPPEKPQSFFAGNISQKQQPEFGLPEGTHVVGGSAFGWNFVTFPESKVTYYGRTKESFRLANPKTQVDDS